MAGNRDRTSPRRGARQPGAPGRHGPAAVPPSTSAAAIEMTWRTAPKARTTYLAPQLWGAEDAPPADDLEAALSVLSAPGIGANDEGPTPTSRSPGHRFHADASAADDGEAAPDDGEAAPDDGEAFDVAGSDNAAAAWNDDAAPLEGAPEDGSFPAEPGPELSAESGAATHEADALFSVEGDGFPPPEGEFGGEPDAAFSQHAPDNADTADAADLFGGQESAYASPGEDFAPAPDGHVDDAPLTTGDGLGIPTEWQASLPPTHEPPQDPTAPPPSEAPPPPPTEGDVAPIAKPEGRRWRMYAAQALIATAAALGGVALGELRGHPPAPEEPVGPRSAATTTARTVHAAAPCPNGPQPDLDLANDPPPRPTLARRRKTNEGTDAPPSPQDRSRSDLRELAAALRAQGGVIRVVKPLDPPPEGATRPAVHRR